MYSNANNFVCVQTTVSCLVRTQCKGVVTFAIALWNFNRNPRFWEFCMRVKDCILLIMHADFAHVKCVHGNSPHWPTQSCLKVTSVWAALHASLHYWLSGDWQWLAWKTKSLWAVLACFRLQLWEPVSATELKRGKFYVLPHNLRIARYKLL